MTREFGARGCLSEDEDDVVECVGGVRVSGEVLEDPRGSAVVQPVVAFVGGTIALRRVD